MEELRAVMQGTITAFVENNTAAVREKDVSLLSSVLTGDCVKMYRPLSFVNRYRHFFKAQISNAEYEAQMEVELQTMSDVTQNVTRTVIDAPQRVANVWIEKTVVTVEGHRSSVEVIKGAVCPPLSPSHRDLWEAEVQPKLTVFDVDKVIYDLEFTQDGRKISQYIEFVDTFESVNVLEQMLSRAGAN